ncbi:MAG: insulinase family protein [candidate division Zixibacteria bacterium]|nr:insulinase family protein [candidate division Zixibacteria bacterium]
MSKFNLFIVTVLISGIIMSCGESPVGGVTRKVLDNGLTVLVKEDHSSPVVSIVTWVSAGYFNEPDSITGISHLLEHMFFKGTSRRGVGELARETRDAGGYLNAGTIYERTSYYTVIPSPSFEKGLDIQSDALINCAIDAEELAKESQVVIQEIKRKLDNPSSFSYEKLLELGFDKHRLRRWRMGYEDQVAGWTRDHLYNYYQTRYRPENIVLSVVGDIETSQALELIDKYYSDFERGEINTEFSPNELPQEAFKYRRMTGDISRNMIHIGYHTAGALHEDFYPLTVLNYILSNGRASRLYQEVKENQGLAQSLESYYESFKDFGYFTISADQADGEPLPLLQSIFEQIERFKLGKVSQAELTRAINQLESSYLHTYEEVNGQASVFAMYESLGDYKMALDYLDRLRIVTADDIQRVALQYFDISNASVIEYLPTSGSFQEYQADEVNQLLTSAVEKYRTGYIAMPAEAGEIAKTRAVGGPNLPDKPAQLKVLDNGITIICRENHSIPLVSVAGFFYGGIFTETEDDAGITRLLARTSLKGTKSMTAAEIAQNTEILGSNISYTVDDDYFGFTFDSMPRNFEEGFSILSEIMLTPSFPADELEKEKGYQIAAINRLKDSMRGYPVALCLEASFEKHPYGLPSMGEVDVIEKVTVDDLTRKHETSVTTGNLVMSFVGDVTMEEAVGLTTKYLDDMKKGERLAKLETEAKLSSVHSKIEKRNKAQSAQSFAFLTCEYSNPDHEPLKVYQNIVSGMGGRLWTEVRDKKSLAYSVYGYQSAGALAGSFICYLATSPLKAVEARDIAMDVLTGFVDRPLSDEELQRSKNYTAGSFSIYIQSNGVQADLYANWELSGRGYKSVDDYPDMIRRVTSDQVMYVAAKYFKDKYYGLGMVEGQGASVQDRD